MTKYEFREALQTGVALCFLKFCFAHNLDTLAGSAYISPDGNRVVAVFINSSFEDIHVEMSFSKTWKRKPTAISSYRTDARHDLAKVVTGKGYDHTIAARGVTTVVLDFSNGK